MVEAADIPGYFYDEDKKRYFKIMPSGPYSLASITQAKRQREQQQKQQARDQIKQHTVKRFFIDSSSMLTFCRQRSTQATFPLRSMVTHGAKSLYTQLTHQGSTLLPVVESSRNGTTTQAACTNMAISSPSGDNEHDNIVIGFQDGSVTRYGFQVKPFLHAWPTSRAWNADADITSLHIGRPSRRQDTSSPFNGDMTQPIIGTSLGQGSAIPNQLWRYTLPVVRSLDNEAAEHIQLEHDAYVTSGRPSAPDPLTLATPLWDCSFVRRKDTFWTSSVAAEHDIILVGGEKHLFILSNSFDFITHIPSGSAVFATHLSINQPHTVWMGCRNGQIMLADSRCKESSQQDNVQFRQGSAVTHIKPLESYSSGHSLLAAGMDGSISLWDTRFSIPALSPSSSSSSSSSSSTAKRRKQYQGRSVRSEPVRQFQGHKNNHSKQLAFDVDTDLHLLAMSGNDNKVRLWSLLEQETQVDPFWSSAEFSGPVCQANLLARPPPMERVWSTMRNKDPASYGRSLHSNPGLLLCAPERSLHWLSIP